MNKREQFIEQSRLAAEDIQTWPTWMQRNLKPPVATLLDRLLDEYYVARHSKDRTRLEEARAAIVAALDRKPTSS